MKHLLKFSAIFLLATTLSCGDSKNNSTDAASSEMNNDGAVIKIDLAKFASQTDLVCGMSLKDGIADTMTFEGKLYGFCSNEHKNTFKVSPDKFLK